MHHNKKTNPANATARVVDELEEALLVHTGHDADHDKPARNRREHRNVTRKTSKRRVPLPLTTTSAATRGAGGGPRRPPLPPLLPLSPPRLVRGGNELLKPGPLLRRPELDRYGKQFVLLLLRAHRHVISWRCP